MSMDHPDFNPTAVGERARAHEADWERVRRAREVSGAARADRADRAEPRSWRARLARWLRRGGR